MNDIQHIYREKTDKRILKKNPWKDYGLHLSVLVLAVIAMYIGPIEIKLTDSVEIAVMPLLYTMVLGLVFYLAKPVTWIERKQSRVAEGAMMLFIGILIAKLAVSSGQSMHLLFEMGPALMLQELGHLATILIALPVALLLGFKRETIGMTNSIGREPEVAALPPEANWLQGGAPLPCHGSSCPPLSQLTNPGPLLPGFLSYQNTSSISSPSTSALQGPEQGLWSLISVCGLIW